MGGRALKHDIGVDVGGAKIALVRGTETGEILQKVRFENDVDCKTALNRMVEEAKKPGPADAIGIRCGGPLDSKKGLIQSPQGMPHFARSFGRIPGRRGCIFPSTTIFARKRKWSSFELNFVSK